MRTCETKPEYNKKVKALCTDKTFVKGYKYGVSKKIAVLRFKDCAILKLYDQPKMLMTGRKHIEEAFKVARYFGQTEWAEQAVLC